MKVAVAQYDIAWEDKKKNYERVDRFLEEAVQKKVDLLILPEMFATAFTMASMEICEPLDGPTVEFLRNRATRHSIHILGTVVIRGERDDVLPTNVALLINRTGKILGRYDKVHPFTMDGEDRHFRPGNNLCISRMMDTLVQPTICYDLRFTELYRGGLDQGVEVMICTANWPAVRAEHWRLLLRTRALENLAFMVGCNRIGESTGHKYSGGSMVVDPFGKVIADAGDEETLLVVEFEPSDSSAARRQVPFVCDRRPDAYARWTTWMRRK